ncbi:RCC1 and BTB domain-containing protein 2 [Trichinella pseudospiralis]|uniref:RCC1 and BTB domain-containing protein 2 n=1 Tax=Trichinella pseudospiralis TaxID=6337 RepID=A0A0V1DXG6_TRIPS|nr:RCC1 and BTB domain-containing protein 2 [Trichinella pseudospiralis]
MLFILFINTSELESFEFDQHSERFHHLKAEDSLHAMDALKFSLPIYSAKTLITFNDFDMDLHTSFSSDEYCMIAFYCSDGKIRILFRNNREQWSVRGCAWYEDPKCTPTSMCFTTCSRWLIVATECGDVRLVPTRLILDDQASKLLLPAHGSILFDQETISLIRIKSSSNHQILATPTSIVCYEAGRSIPVVAYGNKSGEVAVMRLDTSESRVYSLFNESVIRVEHFAGEFEKHFILVTTCLGTKHIVCLDNFLGQMSINVVDTCLPQGDIRIHQNDDQFYFIVQEEKDVKLYDVHNPTTLLTQISLAHIPSAYCFADPISFFTHTSKVYCVFNCLSTSDRPRCFLSACHFELELNFSFSNCKLSPLTNKIGGMPCCLFITAGTIVAITPIKTVADICHSFLKADDLVQVAERWCSATGLRIDSIAEKCGTEFFDAGKPLSALKLFQNLKVPKTDIVKLLIAHGEFTNFWYYVRLWLSNEFDWNADSSYDILFDGFIKEMPYHHSLLTGKWSVRFQQFLSDIPCKDPAGCFKKLIQLGAYTNCWTFLRYCQVESDDMVKTLLEIKQWPVVEPFITILVHALKAVQVQLPKDLLASAQFFRSVYKLLPKLSIYWLEKVYHSINEAFVKTLFLCCYPSEVGVCAGKHKLALAVCRVGARAFALLDSQLYERCSLELAVNDLTCRLDPNRFVKIWPTISSKPAGFIEGTLYAMTTSTKVISSIGLMPNCNGKHDRLMSMVEQPDAMTTPPHILNEHQQLLGRLMIKRVACGRHHLLFMSSVGFVYGRGSNAYGQLGVGQQQLCSKPVLITPCLSVTHPIRRIGCGDYHSVAIDVRGHAYSWGWNAHGQLGLGHVSIVRHPCPMRINQAWLPLQDVQCGIAHTIVLCKNGHLYGCGSNRYAQLGLHLDLVVKQVELVELSFHVQEQQFVLSVASGPFEVFALSNSASGQRIFHWGCSPGLSKPFLRRLIKLTGARCYYEKNRFLPFLPRSLSVENLFGGEQLVSVACSSLYFILRTQSGRLFYWSRDAFLRRLMANDIVNSAPIMMRNPANVPFDWVVCGEEGSFAVDRNGVGWFYSDLFCTGYCCNCNTASIINSSNNSSNNSNNLAFHYILRQLQMRRHRGSGLGTAYSLGVIGNWAPVLPSNTIHTDSVNALSRFFNFAQIVRRQGENEVLELCLQDSRTMSPLKRAGMLILAGQVAEAFSLLCSQLSRRDEQETQTTVEIILQTFLHWFQHFASGDEPRAAYFYGVLQLMQLKAASRPGPVARYLNVHRVWLSQVLSQAIDRTNATINWRALRDSLELNGLLKMKISTQDYIAYGWKATPIEPLPADFTGMLHFGCGHVQFGQLEEVVREKLGNRADHVLRVLGNSLWKDPERALCASCVSSLLEFAATMLPTTKKQLVIEP